jgi:hypothetical protein
VSVKAIHVSDPSLHMGGFDTPQEASDAVRARGGHILSERAHEIVWSDYPRVNEFHSAEWNQLNSPPLTLSMLRSRGE